MFSKVDEHSDFAALLVGQVLDPRHVFIVLQVKRRPKHPKTRLYDEGMWAGMLFPAWLFVAHIGFADEPKPPYKEIDVAYSNPDLGNTELSGTLTEPAAGGPFPAVVLISGAGPQDRDETIAGQKPFRVLADYLTRRGVAVLRADDRGVGRSKGRFEGITTKGLSTDVEAGVRFLQGRSDIDSKQIGLIGHGEGALEAVMVAEDIPSIAFLVMLEGTGVPGEQVLLEQTEQAEKAAGVPKLQIKKDHQVGAMLYDMAKNGAPVSQMYQALADFNLRWLRDQGDDGTTLAPWSARVKEINGPWLRFFLSYDPAPEIAKLKCPVLALNGAKDMQVIADQNAPAIKAALAQGGNKDTRVEVLPGLNYLLQPAQTGLAYEYASSPVAISPLALQTISDWITAHIHPANSAKE